jgi:hypothetical protein
MLFVRDYLERLRVRGDLVAVEVGCVLQLYDCELVLGLLSVYLLKCWSQVGQVCRWRPRELPWVSFGFEMMSL